MNMHFRPKIQNGAVVKRARAGYPAQPAPRPAKVSPLATITPIWAGVSVGALKQSGLAVFGLEGRLQATKVVAKEKTTAHSRVLLGLIGCGVILAGGFMFSLRDHFTAYAVGRDDVNLKSKIEQAEAERQHLDVRLKQAVSPSALDRAAREVVGLAPLEWERKKVVSTAKKVTAAEKAKPSQSEKRQTRTGKTAAH